jgi:acetolactate synthase-1/2/3 large subunit
MVERGDGGEAILEAFRRLGIDYIISSPGSEWPPVWEALARQRANETAGPQYINCWHESLAVAMAMGYTQATGRLQAVLLHTGVGLLQGSLAIHGASQGEVPMLVCSGESITYGEDPEFDPGPQWYRNLSVPGGPNRLAESFVKWSDRVNSPYTLYEAVMRTAEMAQRVPRGPTYLNIPIEVMLAQCPVPDQRRSVPAAPKRLPQPEAIASVADLLSRSENPVILTDSCGRDVEAFRYLVNLAELLAIPVVEGSYPLYANFPKDHPLHQGYDINPFLSRSDLFLLIGSKAPWYPPHASPAQGTVVVIDENPIKGQMAYQSLHADLYLEGDVTTTLRLLVEALQNDGAASDRRVKDRRSHLEAEHQSRERAAQATATSAQHQRPVAPAWLCAAINEGMPDNTVYVEETITHRSAILRHLRWSQPQSYFHPTGGLGQGLGLALGVKLAMPQRPVVALMGDGSFLYNPIVQALGASVENHLPILIIVFNNGSYAAMKGSHLQFYPQGAAATTGVFHGVDIPGPNYAQLVEPFGGYGERVEDPARLKAALGSALEAVNGGRVALLDVVLAS